jgi:carbonic anhydrase
MRIAFFILIFGSVAAYAGKFAKFSKTDLEKILLETHPTEPWSYTDGNGPNFWADMTGSEACKTGLKQSPVDIQTTQNAGLANVRRDSSLEKIRYNWQDSNLHILSNGHTIEAVYDAGSTTTVGQLDYTLKQFHFHSPSEHSLNGEHFPLEGHFLHVAMKNNEPVVMVVTVLYTEGGANPHLDKLLDLTPKGFSDTPIDVPHQTISARDFFPRDNSDYFAYEGSLTAPPCTEDVSWVILKSLKTVSKEQARRVQALLQGPNKRPVQSLNTHRTIRDR